jgi:DNA-directed RNA polymerase specialized sigma subunit
MENKKVKFALRISSETQEQIKEWCVRDNCQSQNEFVDKAVKFYIGYVASRDASEFLPRTLVNSIRGTLDDSENRVARLLFKLAVELSMTMHVVASDRGIGESELAKLRAKCVADVKKSIGTISFDEAVKYQSGY